MSTADAPSSLPSGRRVLIAMIVILLAAVIPAVFVPTLACRPADPELPDLGVVPAFSLVDERGQPFTEEALRGHPTVVDFIFTRCDNICPRMSAHMHGIQDKTFDAGKRLKMVSFSVDPIHDTPSVLTDYARIHQADDSRWRFVTIAPGDPPAKIRTVIETIFWNSMKVTGTQANGAPAIGHTPFFILVDGDLHIRGTYDSDDLTRLDALMRDARYLIRTRKNRD